MLNLTSVNVLFVIECKIVKKKKISNIIPYANKLIYIFNCNKLQIIIMKQSLANINVNF